jgi:hypothetical protein
MKLHVGLGTLLLASIVLPALAMPPLERASANGSVLQTLTRGQPFASGNQQYQLLPEVRAVERHSQHEPPQQILTRLGANGGTQIETKGSFVLFRAAQQGSGRIEQVQSVTMLYPAVVNVRTGVIGVLLGTLSVKPRNMANAAAIANDHGLELVREFAHLQAAFYRVKPGQDVLAAAAVLAADSRVASAEVEVLEHVNAPN